MAEPSALLTSPPVGRLSIAYMSVALEDPNLVHVEPAVAADSELPDVIAHGAFAVSYLGLAASRTHGVAAVRRLDVRVLAPLFPGQAVQVRAGADRPEVSGPSARHERLFLDAFAIPDGVLLARGLVDVHSVR